MVNLVLDTNTWIYLANGNDYRLKGKSENYHFELAARLLKNLDKLNCRVYSNYIIRNEWNNNKKWCYELVKEYERDLNTRHKLLKKLRNPEVLPVEAKKFGEFKKEIQEKIKRNTEHIETIEKILFKAIDIPIYDSHKIKAVDLALNKEPPFHRNKNNVADAIIFLSTVDFFSFNEDLYLKDTFFISSNTEDFSEFVKDDKLHPAILGLA